MSDEAALCFVIKTPSRYIGMIGSRAKCQAVISHLYDAGYTEKELNRIHAPIGLDLGGPTPHEIAVAILAEVIALRRGCLDPVPFRRITQGEK